MELLVLVAGITAIALMAGYGYALRVMPVPTSPAMRRAAAGLMPANPQTIIELGSGWGGMTRVLAKTFPKADIVAYEKSPLPWAVSRLFHPVRRQDVFTADLSRADVVFCYLSPWHMEYLKDRFDTMKPGAALISVSLPIMGRDADATREVGFTRVYRYTVPA